MRSEISDIILKSNIELFGFCKFESVSKNLINCRAMDRLPKNPKTIITFAFPYKVKVGDHNISRYAIVRDYHDVIFKILNEISKDLVDRFPKYSFESFVDNSPIPEVRSACLSGLGVLGENGLLITPKYGSWVFIGEIVSDIEIKFSLDERINSCLQCKLCKKYCPGQAIDNSKICTQKCLSHISQKKGTLSDFEKESLKKSSLIWGCDVCQEVCPMNKLKEDTNIPYFLNGIYPIIKSGDYDKLQDRAFKWRPKSVIERNILLSEYT